MMSREIKAVLVLGFGTMGTGIAQVAASVGYEVKVFDLTPQIIEQGIEKIRKNLSRGLSKGTINDDEISQIINRIKGHVNLEQAIKNIDFVIEAVSEEITIKIDLFSKLNELLPEDVVIASNTSIISVSLLGEGSKRADRFIGMHFFNPPPLMNLIELTTSNQTSEETLEIAITVAKKIGKETIILKDSPGFIVNRFLVPMLNEAIFLLQEGIATVETIDKGARLGLLHKVGPFQVMDLIGLDTYLFMAERLYEAFQDSKYRVPQLLRQMVAAGKLGRKNGEGFYSYK